MIKKISLQKLIYILTITIIVGLPLIKFTSYNLFLANIASDAFVLKQVYLLWIMIPILMITYLYGVIIKNYKFNYADIIIYILIITAFISTFFAVDIDKSIFGEYLRDEGLLSLISYYLIFLNVKNINNDKYKRGIVNIFILMGLFQVLYAILQVYTQFNFIKHYSKPYMAMGLSGNPNFFGSYVIMLLFITLFLYLIKKEKKYLFLTVLFFFSLCLAGSTGPFLGFIIGLVFLLVLYYKKIDIKRTILIIFILILTYFSVDVSLKTVQEKKFGNKIESDYNITSEIVKITKNYKGENIGNGRLQLWLRTIPVADKYWLTGAGLDNFGLVFPQTGSIYFDKAHNVYLQMLVTNGLFSLIAYSILCLIIFIKGFKFKKPLSIALFGAFVGYSIQAFANISVIDVAPIFFIILGLLCALEE